LQQGIEKAMTRRRVLCGPLFASVVLACFAGWLWATSGPRVTRARFEQVREGMSRDEVIRIVGGPPGYYSTLPSSYIQFCHLEHEKWFCDDGTLLVRIDGDTATNVEVLAGVNPGPPTLTQRIRRWLGL
jgi:hypothetical protein